MNFNGYWKLINNFNADIRGGWGTYWWGIIYIPTYTIGKKEHILRVFSVWDEKGNHISDSDLSLKIKLDGVLEPKREAIDPPEFVLKHQ